MTNRELYQETFSQVHSSARIRWEDFAQERKPRRKRPVRRLWLLAAVLALVAILSAAAVAAHLMGLRDLVLPAGQQVQATEESGGALPSPTQAVNNLSLSGYLNTPESQGLAEWNDFLASYDPDGAILKVVGNYIDPELAKYNGYLVYTQDMADKLEEIAAKYRLTLHTWNHMVEDQGEWVTLLGDFLGKNTAYSGRIYEDGTFHYDGYLVTNSGTQLDYQFRRSVKGALNDVYLPVDDLSAYEEWYYKTDEGREITLDLGPDRGFLLTDLGDCFIFVNVLEGAGQGVTKQDMKDLADSFDFSLLTPARPPDEAPQQSQQPGPALPGELETVLLEDGAFYDTDFGTDTTLSRLLAENAPEGCQLEVESFAVIDLDRDSTAEAVLRLTLNPGSIYGYEVLCRSRAGTVCGFALTERQFLDLKDDGSFSYSGGISNSGFGFLFVSAADPTDKPFWYTDPIAYMESCLDQDGMEYTDYYLRYQSITQEEYQAALACQQGKKNADWYPFTQENLESFFSSQ